MAVYCGVCASRIHSALENGGAFQVTEKFHDESGHLTRWLDDTCESCAQSLREATTTRAMEIAAKNMDRIVALREQVKKYKEEEAGYNRARAEFEIAWAAQRDKVT